jgi:hypothetical protein
MLLKNLSSSESSLSRNKNRLDFLVKFLLLFLPETTLTYPLHNITDLRSYYLACLAKVKELTDQGFDFILDFHRDPLFDIYHYFVHSAGKPIGHIRFMSIGNSLFLLEIYPHLPRGSGYGISLLVYLLLSNNTFAGKHFEVDTPNSDAGRALHKMSLQLGFHTKKVQPTRWLFYGTVPSLPADLANKGEINNFPERGSS